MPAARKPQNSGVLGVLVAFGGLFIVAATVAIIFYSKSEDHKARAERAEDQVKELIDNRQWQNKATLIGAKKSQTYVNTMVEYLDQAVAAIIGGPLKETSAETKMVTVNEKLNQIIALATADPNVIESIDPNTTGLVRIIELLNEKVKARGDQIASLLLQIRDLQDEFEVHKREALESETKLLAQKAQHEEHIAAITKQYEELKIVMEQNVSEQIKNLTDKHDAVAAERDQLDNDLLRTQAQLDATQEKLELIQERLEKIVPPPSTDIAAFKPDGLVILVDNQVVHLDIGSDDRVYQGLTFAIYDKGLPLPKDGKGKAEIEIFDVSKNVSIGRITKSQLKQPIVVGDIAANLIWNSDKTSIFVVAGLFDLDGDGVTEYDGIDKVKSHIEKWGGKVADEVVVDTDFVVLGKSPRIVKRPTIDDLELDPTAIEKFEASQRKRDYYDQVQSRAEALSVPVFNTERFLHFIGYKTLSARADAF
jgi:hypothetical protein